MNDKQKFDLKTGDEARRLRKDSKLTLKYVSGQMGISAPYLCDLELGRRHWTPEKINQFRSAILDFLLIELD